MLLWVIGVLSVILGFCIAANLVFHRFGCRVNWFSILITAVASLIISVVTILVMLTVIWPPVTVASWVLFAVFAGIALMLLLATKKKTEEGW